VNKVTAEGPRQKEDTHVPPPKTGGKGREFDRQSGTGRPPNESKKGGSGPGNWGKPGEDELKAEADVQAELAAGAEGSAAPAADGAAAPKKNKKKKKGAEETEEKDKKDEIPDEQLVLYDEYQKQQEKKNKVKVKLPSVRQAGEGVKEDPKWATGTKLDRGGDDVVFFSAKPPKEQPKAEAAGDKKKLSKNQYKKAKERKAREAARQKLEKDNISQMFDFSAKKESDRGERPAGRGGRGNGPRPPRGPRASPKEESTRPRNFPGGRGAGSPAAGGAPVKKFTRGSDAPQFDDSSFPALQLGP